MGFILFNQLFNLFSITLNLSPNLNFETRSFWLIKDIELRQSLIQEYKRRWFPEVQHSSSVTLVGFNTIMKAFIALLIASLAVAAQGSYLEPAWPVSSWNGLNSWNNHALTAYPYGVNQWSSAAWPAASSLYNGWYGADKTIVQANVAKINPWGVPAAAYGYGYNNYLGAVPAAKYVAPLVGHGINRKVVVSGHGF